MKRHQKTKRIPVRLGYGRMNTIYIVMDMLLYSFIMTFVYFYYLSKIEDTWYFIYNEKLMGIWLNAFIISILASLCCKIFTGVHSKVFTIKSIVITFFASMFVAILLYLDIVMLIFNEFSLAPALVLLFLLKAINVVISTFMGELVM